MEDPHFSEINIDTNTTEVDTGMTNYETINKQMKIEIITTQQQTQQTQQTQQAAIHNLKETIQTIEMYLSSMKKQLSLFETTTSRQNEENHIKKTNSTIQPQPQPQPHLKQQKIKDTALFNGNKTTSTKKIKLDIGFNIERSITPELCRFMNLASGSTTTLNDATKSIINYINLNKLQDITNPLMRKYINVDNTLIQLFNLPESEKTRITYFNLHKYIHCHFTNKP